MWSVLALIALAQANPICWKVSGVTKCVPEGNRVTHGAHVGRAGGRSGSQPAPFFAFATASGVGVGTACACAAITGTKGEAITVTRGTSAYCTKEGAATTGITTTSMVLCGNNLPRVEVDGSGALGVRVENTASTTLAAATSEDFGNVGWTSTATVTVDTTTAPSNALTADTLSDVSGAAIQSSCQTITTSSATQHTLSVYLTAGTIAKAGITMTGTGSSTGDCSNTTTALGATYTRLSCTSPAAYAGTLTAVTVCVQVGTVVGDTGTIIAWGADHKVSAPYLTSYVPSSLGTRNSDLYTAAVAVTQIPLSLAWTSGTVLPASITPDRIGLMPRALAGSGNFFVSYFQAQYRVDASGSATNSVTNAGTSAVGDRWAASHTAGGVLTAYKNGVSTGTSTLAKTMADATIVGIGSSPTGVSILDGIISRVCLDPNPDRCR